MVDEITHLGLMDEAEIELDRAALQIAALDHAGADLSGYLEVLDQATARLRARSAAVRTPAHVAGRLAEVLAGEFGFDGDRDTYDEPANADLISVIDRRRGLPVALAILYVALARRVGWAAYALNVPGHVLVGVGRPPTVVVDPFNRGALVGREQLIRLYRSAPADSDAFAPEAIRPMTNRAVLVRLLTNQASRAEVAGQFARALTVYHRITTAAPEYAWGWWERARLEQMAGDVAAARKSLSSMLETTRDSGLRSRAASALRSLA
jgi:regulator of sirC expression with transglutaminase-like and TPR domain